jgi:hypothetical protein
VKLNGGDESRDGEEGWSGRLKEKRVVDRVAELSQLLSRNTETSI